MKLHLLSDIHLEFGKFRHNPPECDVAVLAGDIGVGAMALPWISDTFVKRGIPAVYVVGNHEFYNRDITKLIPELEKKCQDRGIHFLSNSSVEISGVTILGTTLWTDYNLYGTSQISALIAQRALNDFDNIKNAGERLFSDDVMTMNKTAVEFLSSFIGVPGKKVVVTHHAPSEYCISHKYRNNDLNPCYASRLEGLIWNLEAEAWIHGHLHDPVDIVINKTRILCNPRGYVGHMINSEFDSKMVIDV